MEKDKEEVMYIPVGNYQEKEFVSEDDIDLKAIMVEIWQNRLLITIIVFLFAISSIFFSLSLPNIYASSAKVSPVTSDKQSGLASLAGQFGGLASLAGINIGGGESDKTALTIEILTSRNFIIDFIKSNDLLVPLIAADSWDPETGELLIDDDIYSVGERQWVREVSYPKTTIPSDLEAYEVFMESLSVTQEQESGIVTIALQHVSPELARKWVTLIVAAINETMKVKDQNQARKSIEYLQEQLEETTVVENRTLLFQLIEEQTKTLMFTAVRDEYIFETIDPALTPEKKIKPNRVIIVLLATVAGLIFSFIIIFVKSFYRKVDI